MWEKVGMHQNNFTELKPKITFNKQLFKWHLFSNQQCNKTKVEFKHWNICISII